MRSYCAQYPLAHANRSLSIDATASRARQKLPAVRRSLAGLPVHRAPGLCSNSSALRLRHVRGRKNKYWYSAGGLLIVPVLQPAADNIPFGLALSLQSQASASLPGVGAQHDQEDLYELQYVLEGQGEASTASKTPLEVVTQLTQELTLTAYVCNCCSCVPILDCCKALLLGTAYLLQLDGHGVSLLRSSPQRVTWQY